MSLSAQRVLRWVFFGAHVCAPGTTARDGSSTCHRNISQPGQAASARGPSPRQTGETAYTYTFRCLWRTHFVTSTCARKFHCTSTMCGVSNGPCRNARAISMRIVGGVKQNQEDNLQYANLGRSTAFDILQAVLGTRGNGKRQSVRICRPARPTSVSGLFFCMQHWILDFGRFFQ